jgi:hypothetical protein
MRRFSTSTVLRVERRESRQHYKYCWGGEAVLKTEQKRSYVCISEDAYSKSKTLFPKEYLRFLLLQKISRVRRFRAYWNLEWQDPWIAVLTC